MDAATRCVCAVIVDSLLNRGFSPGVMAEAVARRLAEQMVGSQGRSLGSRWRLRNAMRHAATLGVTGSGAIRANEVIGICEALEDGWRAAGLEVGG